MNLEECKQVLLSGTKKIDLILNPSGYFFEVSNTGETHGGYFATGYYKKGNKIIQLIYRTGTGLGSVSYGYRQYSGNYIQIDVAHHDLIQHLGKNDESKLRYSDSKFASISKDRGDPFEALSYDIQNFTLDILNSPDSDFEDILRQASLSAKAEGKRKKSAPKASNAIWVGIIGGLITGIGIARISGNLSLGIVLGFVLGLIIFALFFRKKRN